MLQNKISITTDEARALIYVLNRPDKAHFSHEEVITWLQENVIVGQKFVYRFADLPYELKCLYRFHRCEHCGWDSEYQNAVIDNDDRIQIVKQWYLNARRAKLKDIKSSILLSDGQNSKYQKLLRQIVEDNYDDVVCEKYNCTRFYFDKGGCIKVADELFKLICENAEVPCYIFMARKQMSIILKSLEKETKNLQ